jgi:hypothetical protein
LIAVHISNHSIASLFQLMQAMASGSSVSASFGAQMTGQNLPTITAGASLTSSQAPSPLSSTPSSQFASSILSALLAAQQSPQPAQTVAASAAPGSGTTSTAGDGAATSTSATPRSPTVSVAA